MKVDLKGFRALEEALVDLEQFSGRTTNGKNAVKRGMIAAMQRIESRAKQLAPREQGDLAESITTKFERAKRQRGSARYARQSGVTVLTGPAPIGKVNRANAGWQERGTVKMPANAYMRPAADSEGQSVVDEVVDLITAEVAKATERARKKAAKGK